MQNNSGVAGVILTIVPSCGRRECTGQIGLFFAQILNVSYSFDPRYTVFLNVNNIFANPLTSTYVYYAPRTVDNDGWQQHVKFGSNGRL